MSDTMSSGETPSPPKRLRVAPDVAPLVLCPAEVAALIAVSRATFDRLVAGGKFPPPSLRIGRHPRWQRSLVERWVELGGPDAAEFAARLAAEQRRAR